MSRRRENEERLLPRKQQIPKMSTRHAGYVQAFLRLACGCFFLHCDRRSIHAASGAVTHGGWRRGEEGVPAARWGMVLISKGCHGQEHHDRHDRDAVSWRQEGCDGCYNECLFNEIVYTKVGTQSSVFNSSTKDHMFDSMTNF